MNVTYIVALLYYLNNIIINVGFTSPRYFHFKFFKASNLDRNMVVTNNPIIDTLHLECMNLLLINIDDCEHYKAPKFNLICSSNNKCPLLSYNVHFDIR